MAVFGPIFRSGLFGKIGQKTAKKSPRKKKIRKKFSQNRQKMAIFDRFLSVQKSK